MNKLGLSNVHNIVIEIVETFLLESWLMEEEHSVAMVSPLAVASATVEINSYLQLIGLDIIESLLFVNPLAQEAVSLLMSLVIFNYHLLGTVVYVDLP